MRKETIIVNKGSKKMRTKYTVLYSVAIILLVSQLALADTPSSLGSGFDVQDFYKPFTIEEITPANQQTWPYYKYVSVHWDEYALHGTEKIKRSSKPVKFKIAEVEKAIDLNTEWKDGKSFIESLQSTQVKGFAVIKGNTILAEYYDNGFNVNDTQLIQSASKTFAGVITSLLIDEGLIDPNAKIEKYLEDLKGTDVGSAAVQHVLDMTSGLPAMLDFHTPGAPGYLFEIEQGMKPGKPMGHLKAIKGTKAVAKSGEEWHYSDKNTDTLGLLAEAVTGKKFPELLSELFGTFGANYDGSIALTSDGTTSPAYGISISLRDYALFHQWLAQGSGPKSFYASVKDVGKKKLFSEKSKLLGQEMIYGSQTYYMAEHDILYSQGSFGQNGYSDLKTGISVVFFQDWGTNVELDKYHETNERAIAVINYLRIKADPYLFPGRNF